MSKEETDDWGATYPPGAEIIRGWFLTCNGNTRSSYQYNLVVDKKAVVYAATVRYICPELNVSGKHTYQISEELHLDILQSLHGF